MLAGIKNKPTTLFSPASDPFPRELPGTGAAEPFSGARAFLTGPTPGFTHGTSSGGQPDCGPRGMPPPYLLIRTPPSQTEGGVEGTPPLVELCGRKMECFSGAKNVFPGAQLRWPTGLRILSPLSPPPLLPQTPDTDPRSVTGVNGGLLERDEKPATAIS